MSIVALLNPVNKTGQEIRSYLQRMNLDVGSQYYENVSSLIYFLRHSIPRHGVALLQITDLEELEAILKVSELFRHFRIILILPGQDPEIISKGHLLRPRSILFGDGEIQQVEDILKKMLALGRDRRRTDRTGSCLS